jgi:hypothetical protein
MLCWRKAISQDGFRAKGFDFLPDADEVVVIRRELVRSEAIYQQNNILCPPLRRPAWLAS